MFFNLIDQVWVHHHRKHQIQQEKRAHEYEHEAEHCREERRRYRLLHVVHDSLPVVEGDYLEHGYECLTEVIKRPYAELDSLVVFVPVMLGFQPPVDLASTDAFGVEIVRALCIHGETFGPKLILVGSAQLALFWPRGRV